MDLQLKDVADLLNVSHATIEGLVRADLIPHYFINGQYRFNRNEIEDWLLTQSGGSKVKTDFSILLQSAQALKDAQVLQGTHTEGLEASLASNTRSKGHKQFSLFRAVHKGGVLYNVQGDTKKELIKNTVKTLSSNLNFDPEVISHLLLEREEMQSTGLNHGIAIPHTREFLLNNHHDIVTVVCLDNPIPYDSLDRQPVHTLFFLFANSDRHHLQLLAKIAHLSSSLQTIDFLKSRPTKDQLLRYIKEWESTKF